MMGSETSLARKILTACAITVLSGIASTAIAQAWPAKPIAYVVPFAPGGNTDTLARIIGPKLSAALGQPVVVDNRPGAGGNIGSAYVAKANPDGYTILGGTISSHAINESIYPKMPYDSLKSFEPIIMIGSAPLVVVVRADSRYKTLKDLLADAKAKPGELTFASAGTGTSPHLAGELLKSIAKVDMTHIPYKGSGPALTDVIGGQVAFMCDTALIVGSQVKAGKLRALAVASPKRIKMMPDVPTAAEADVTGFEIGSWQAIFAPAGTPKPVVQKLNTEIAKTFKIPEVKDRIEGLGFDIGGGKAEELGDFQKAEISKWAKIVKEAKIKAD